MVRSAAKPLEGLSMPKYTVVPVGSVANLLRGTSNRYGIMRDDMSVIVDMSKAEAEAAARALNGMDKPVTASVKAAP